MTCMRKFARLLRCTGLLRTRTCNMHACMYFVCVHVYVCVCVCVCVFVCMHIWCGMCRCVCMSVCAYMAAYAYVYAC